MEIDLSGVMWGPVVAVPLVTGLVELVKRLGMPARWAPLLALVLALGINLAAAYVQGQTDAVGLFNAVILGLAIGLSSVGLYSSGRTVVDGIEARALANHMGYAQIGVRGRGEPPPGGMGGSGL